MFIDTYFWGYIKQIFLLSLLKMDHVISSWDVTHVSVTLLATSSILGHLRHMCLQTVFYMP